MKTKPYHSVSISSLFAAGILFTSLAGRAATIAGPYAPDAYTLHLWHMDASAVPVPDVATNGNTTNLVKLANGATLGNASFSGFGNAVSTIDGGQNGIAATSTDAYLSPNSAPPANISLPLADPVTGAFTFEIIVRINFDPTANLGTVGVGGNGRNTTCMLLTGESNTNANRIFQFRIAPIQTINANTTVRMEFNNVNQGGTSQLISVPIPTTGPDAIISNNWYHIAVAYNGVANTANNMQFYWTLMDGTRTNASLLISTNNARSLPVTPTVFGIGNIPGRTANANFLGLIDEVRISSIARASNDMMFAGAAPSIPNAGQPANVNVNIGQTATFSVKALGLDPLAYQWQVNGTNIPSATTNSYSIPSAQLTDAGPYDVIVSNSYNSITSMVATLTVNPRTPLNLAWLGLNSADWDTSTTNWVTTDTATNTPYTEGDNVTFDVNGSGVPTVNLTATFNPSSVLVNSAGTYTLTSSAGGSIAGQTGLTNEGGGTLVLDTDNTYTGPTVIQSGILQLGAADAHGIPGTGPITNNGGLVINRTGILALTNTLAGTGGITNVLGGTTSLSGSNTFSGPVTWDAGTLLLVGTPAAGNTTNITLNASVNGSLGTAVELSGGVTLASNLTISMLGTTASPDARCSVEAAGNGPANVVNGPVVLDGGNGTANFFTGANNEMDVYSSISQPAFVGHLTLRGTGVGHFYGTINLPNADHVSTTDGGTWVIHSTGNNWTNSNFAAGILRIAANNALPTAIIMQLGGTFDLGGFNQQVAGLVDGSGVETITNSNPASSSVLMLNSALPWLFSGVIKDAANGGTGNVGLTLTGGGTLTLAGNSTYTGDTTVSAGTLALSGAGNLNSSNGSIILAAGTTFDVSAVSAPPYHVRTGKTLSCGDPSGGATINGALTENGGGFLSLNYVSGTPALNVTGGAMTLTGCATKVTVSGSALALGSYKLISAGAGGSVTGTLPPAVTVAGSGMAAGAIAALRITAGELWMDVESPQPPVITTTSFDGSNLIFNGTNGIAGHTFYVLSSTNVSTPVTNWIAIYTNAFDGSGAFSVTNAVSNSVPARFFLIELPLP